MVSLWPVGCRTPAAFFLNRQGYLFHRVFYLFAIGSFGENEGQHRFCAGCWQQFLQRLFQKQVRVLRFVTGPNFSIEFRFTKGSTSANSLSVSPLYALVKGTSFSPSFTAKV